ncbi:MAG: flavoprotein, partial [Reyranella sp.]
SDSDIDACHVKSSASPSLCVTPYSNLPDRPNRLVIGISGESGLVCGAHLLQALQEVAVETHLVMTRTAEVTLAHETSMKVADVQALVGRTNRADDLAATVSSGSFFSLGMMVAQCSMRSLGEIVAGSAPLRWRSWDM